MTVNIAQELSALASHLHEIRGAYETYSAEAAAFERGYEEASKFWRQRRHAEQPSAQLRAIAGRLEANMPPKTPESEAERVVILRTTALIYEQALRLEGKQ